MEPMRRPAPCWLTTLLLALVATAALLFPTRAFAESSGQVVRVGWFESPFNSTDELGRRSGYSYEYQQRIAAYTGWTYEYVEGSWPDLLQMLMDGRIDLLSDVSYTEDRAQHILYASLPMGAEDYYLFAAANNTKISADNLKSFDGKRVGVNKGSVQADFFRTWAETNDVKAELIETTDLEEDNFTNLSRGKLDLYVAVDAVGESHTAVPICKIGSSDFFFAVSKARPELLSELNAAIGRIQDERPSYHQELAAKHFASSGTSRLLSADERAWLDEHGPIRVGYQNNYLAFCASDPTTGELTGALKDYLDIAADCLDNAHIDFEAVPYPTAADALDALKRGEVDCMFPANLTDYDGEMQGFFLTSPLMHTDMSAVIRQNDREIFAAKERVTVAVDAGNTNYDMFLLDHFPAWRSIYFQDTPECLQAVAEGKADCLLISNYRYNNIAALCDRYHLTTLSAGVEMDYFFAVSRDDMTVYSILNRVTDVVPDSSVTAALTHYFAEDAKTSLGDTAWHNLSAAAAVIVVVIILAVGITFIITRHKKQKSNEP